jgi:two-component system LytT family response regulator
LETETNVPIRALIVDDEPLARARVRRLLGAHPDFEVVRECADGKSAIAALREIDVDVAFLDVQMPAVDGFGVLQEVPADRIPVVIFVTAHDEHAMRAFDVHALDYLLKPFDAARFERAVKRARRQLELESSRGEAVEKRLASIFTLLDATAARPASILVKTATRTAVVPVSEIRWIEASGKHVKIHAGRDAYLHREPLRKVLERLDPRRFVQIHRSTVVQLSSIESLEPSFHGDHSVLLRDGTRLVLSRSFRGKLEALLGQRF